jgi:hypothetical protein
MKIARDNAATILLELETLGFKPVGKDTAQCRILERRNQKGHTDLQVILNFDVEDKVNDLTVRGFDSRTGTLVDWSMDVTGGAPLAAFLAFVLNA